MNEKHPMKNIVPASIVPLFAGAALLALAAPTFAQSAVRDEFPTGKLRGERYEHFTKEQWEASNFAAPEAMKAWQDRRYGMFIHFGITSKPENGICRGAASASAMRRIRRASWPTGKSARKNGRLGPRT